MTAATAHRGRRAARRRNRNGGAGAPFILCTRPAGTSRIGSREEAAKEICEQREEPVISAVTVIYPERASREFEEARHYRAMTEQARGKLRRYRARRRASLMVGAPIAAGLAAVSGALAAGGPGGLVPALKSSKNKFTGQDDTADPRHTRLDARRLNASAAFKAALIEEEGVRRTVYRDIAGYATVGVGHLVDPGDGLSVGDTISRERVLALLDRDLREAERHVAELVGGLKLYQHEFDALVDLVYNVGPGNVSESESPRLNAAIASGDYADIARELEYTTAAGRQARGLVYRSERRRQIFEEGVYRDPRHVA